MNPDLELSRAAAFGVLLASEGNEELARRYLTRYCLWPHGVMLESVAREVARGLAESFVTRLEEQKILVAHQFRSAILEALAKLGTQQAEEI